MTKQEVKAQIDVLEEVLKEDFLTNNKESVPFNEEVKIIRNRIQNRIYRLKVKRHKVY